MDGLAPRRCCTAARSGTLRTILATIPARKLGTAYARPPASAAAAPRVSRGRLASIKFVWPAHDAFLSKIPADMMHVDDWTFVCARAGGVTTYF